MKKVRHGVDDRYLDDRESIKPHNITRSARMYITQSRKRDGSDRQVEHTRLQRSNETSVDAWMIATTFQKAQTAHFSVVATNAPPHCTGSKDEYLVKKN